MSFASPPQPERRRRVTGLAELRALAHPLRIALLDQLMSHGEQTAAQLADATGSTTSNCSYHLRALHRAGFVERATSADGRERPWRATVTGFTYGSGDDRTPAESEAARMLDELSVEHEEELTREARARHDAQPEPWRAAEAFHNYALRISPAELTALTAEVDRLVRPYIAMTRPDAPTDADLARVRLLAFRDPRSS